MRPDPVQEWEDIGKFAIVAVTLERANVSIDDVDAVVLHQANARIIDAACKRLGSHPDKSIKVIQNTGNTSSASIPLTLDEGVRSGRINDGDTVLLAGFGAGMTYASAVVQWGA